MSYVRTRLLAPIESYALLPTVLALTLLGVDRSDLHSIFKFFLFGAIFLLSYGLTKESEAAIVLCAAVLIDKSLFLNPVVLYAAAVLLGGFLFFRRHPSEQAPIGFVLGGIYTLGIFPLLFPDSFIRWLVPAVLLLALIVLFWLWKRGDFQVSEIAINPMDYLDPKLCPGPNEYNANRDRFILYCIFFLVLGAPSWSLLVELLNFRIAALIHVSISILVPTALLSLVGIPFDSVHYHDNTAALVPTGPSQAELLAALEAERRLRERRELLLAENHFFFGRTWDQLIASFANHLQTILPNGNRVEASDHLIIGVESRTEGPDIRYSPIYLHRPILKDHIHILGGTGSGKTSLAIAPIAIQLIRGFAEKTDSGELAPSDPQPLVIFDIKGDPALFQTIYEEARVRGQDFLFFTVDSTKPSFYFNPFQTLRKHGATVSEQAHQLLDALNLNHGEEYGASYFTRMNRQGLLQVLRSPDGPPQSLREVYERLRKDVKKQKKAEELFAALEGLIDYPQLYTTKEQEENEPETIIDFDRVLEKNQVVYFSLTAPTQSIAVREIGKLAIYSFFMAAIRRTANGTGKQAYMIIDEFQRLIGENLGQILEQARGFGISAILANQNIAQLKSRNGQLWSLVNSNVRASLHFGSGDPEELRLLSEMSGEVIEQMRSVTETLGRTAGESSGTSGGQSETYGGPSSTTTVSRGSSYSLSTSESRSSAETREDVYRPRFRIQDLNVWFNKPRRFIYWVRRGSELSDYDGLPIKVEGLFTIDQLTYEKRKRLPWPPGPQPSIDSPKGKTGPVKERLVSILNDNFGE